MAMLRWNERIAVRVIGPIAPSGFSRRNFRSKSPCWMTRICSLASFGQPGGSMSGGGGAATVSGAAASVAGLGGDSVSTMILNSLCPILCARSSSAGVRMRWRVWLRWAAVLASADSPPRFVCRSNSAAMANQASAVASSLGVASPRSWMSPRVNMDAAIPWRAAERSSSMASLPSRGAPLPSRSSSARLCLAAGMSAATALRYHSMARAESRSTTKPRSYITATLKAEAAEPFWAARSSQPAPACWSLVTPMPWISRRASSSMAGISFAAAFGRSSSIGMAAQSIGLAGSAAAAGGAAPRTSSAAVGSGGAATSGRATAAGMAGAGAASLPGRFAVSARTASDPAACCCGAVAGLWDSQTPVAATPATRMPTVAKTAGRFANDGAAATDLVQLILPIILQP